MALSSLFLSLLLKIVVTFVFIVVNALVIREILVLFKNTDDTFGTSTALAFWIGITLLITGFLKDFQFVTWIIAAGANLFFIYLYKHYSGKAWEESILLWECWLSIMIYLAMFIAALSLQVWTLILWGAIPLLVNFSYVLVLKANLDQRWVNIPSTFLGFASLNIVMVLILQSIVVL